jgi:hypothetical protein
MSTGTKRRQPLSITGHSVIATYCPLEEAKRLKDEKKVAKNSGYEYTDRLTSQKMVEFHVDTCKTFMQQMNEETRFGGNLSVRMLPCQRPVIVMGQDECIVKQYSFTKKAWLGPEGEQPITPKDVVMV